jgi:NitT/TauT family transport system permease protein
MADQVAPPPPSPARRLWITALRDLLAFRRDIPLWQEVLIGVLCVGVVFLLWWYVTSGEEDQRILSSMKLPSPAETFGTFRNLWFEQELTRNTLATLKRVTVGFTLAAIVGIPLGVLCGCFARVNAFFTPLTLFGRNIPIAALMGFSYILFGIEEEMKVMFIFFACVAFILADTTRSVRDVGGQYVDTAYTLGASRRQVILKVLVPLAMPSIFNSLRLLYGLAFGYIMLVESIRSGDEPGGLGFIINTALRVKNVEAYGRVILILLIIPLVALGIDRFLFWIQKELFPHYYGGAGILNRALGTVLHAWDDLKTWLWRRAAPAELAAPQGPDGGGNKP